MWILGVAPELKHITSFNAFFRIVPCDDYSQWYWHPTAEYRLCEPPGLSLVLQEQPRKALFIFPCLSQGYLSSSFYGKISLHFLSETYLLGVPYLQLDCFVSCQPCYFMLQKTQDLGMRYSIPEFFKHRCRCLTGCSVGCGQMNASCLDIDRYWG